MGSLPGRREAGRARKQHAHHGPIASTRTRSAAQQPAAECSHADRRLLAVGLEQGRQVTVIHRRVRLLHWRLAPPEAVNAHQQRVDGAARPHLRGCVTATLLQGARCATQQQASEINRSSTHVRAHGRRLVAAQRAYAERHAQHPGEKNPPVDIAMVCCALHGIGTPVLLRLPSSIEPLRPARPGSCEPPRPAAANEGAWRQTHGQSTHTQCRGPSRHVALGWVQQAPQTGHAQRKPCDSKTGLTLRPDAGLRSSLLSAALSACTQWASRISTGSSRVARSRARPAPNTLPAFRTGGISGRLDPPATHTSRPG